MGELYVEQTGTGEPVVLVHSSGFSGRQWRHLVKELVVRGKRTIVPDLTGHGRSPPWPEPEPFSFRTDVERVVELLRAHGRAHVVGHSYGGLLALHAALTVPELVRSLQLFEPVAFPVLDPQADRDALGELEAVDHAWHSAVPWLTSFVDFWGGAGAWEALREPVRAELVRVGWVVQEGARTLANDTTPLDAYRVLRCPVQLLTGDRSPLPARRVAELLASAIAGARITVIAGAGHFAPVTAPDRVDRAIVEAIDDIDRATHAS